jgi:hypothetical protein
MWNIRIDIYLVLRFWPENFCFGRLNLLSLAVQFSVAWKMGLKDSEEVTPADSY